MDVLRSKNKRQQKIDPRMDPHTEATKRLRASLGIAMKTDFKKIKATRHVKDTDYPTMDDINQHGKKFGILCLKKKYDIITDFMPGDVLEETQEDLI